MTYHRNYNDTNEKPLLGDASPDNDEWAGWVDEWKEDGSKSPSSQPSVNKDEEEPWEDWSNQTGSAQSPATTNNTDPADDWNNDGWGDADLPSVDTATATADNKASASKAKHKKKRPTTRDRSAEPATANLIDFGNSAANKGAPEQGLDNEVWAAEGEDDMWQTLELDATPAKSTSYRPKSKKGD